MKEPAMKRRNIVSGVAMVCGGVWAFLLTSAGICGSSDGSPGLRDPYIDLGRGPVWIHAPVAYDPEIAWPLVLLLHGRGSSGENIENYLKFEPLIDEYGFFYLHPDGMVDADGYRFWNATDACCDFYNTGVDDSGYLLALIDEMKSRYNIDERRVYFIGHSNGGFMSYRMACDHAETVAAIASLAGVTFYDPDDCTPAAPVHVLHIHGTNDTGLLYEGGEFFGVPYPGAVQTVETWATYDGCELVFETLPPLDLDGYIPGDETEVTRYATECEPGGSAELWTIVGGTHNPTFTPDFSPLVIEFLLAHPKLCPADFDEDGDVDTGDLLALLAAWGDCPGLPCPWDFNGDGVVDELDEDILWEHWGDCPEPPEECPWDLNGDGVVNFQDLADLQEHFGPCPLDECPTDVDGDGDTDTADLLALLAAWGDCL